jgi:predicted MFS family arabinose efflux permease
MIVPVAQAYVADITPEGREGFYMGLFNMAMFLSLSVGPFMGGVINVHYGLASAFTAMGVMAMAAFVLSYAFLPAVQFERVKRSGKKPGSWRMILSSRSIMGLCGFRFAYTTCVGVIWCFLPLFASTRFNMNSSDIGTLVMVMVLVGGIINTPMGYVADRFNKPVLVILGGLLVVLAMVSIEWADGFLFLMISAIVFGLGGGISIPALSAMAVFEGKKTDSQGTVMSLLTMAHSMGMLTGSLIAGLTMDYFSLNHAFPFASVIMAAGILYFVWTIYTKERNVTVLID